jgi:hypothetical protein
MNDRIGYRLVTWWFVCLALGLSQTGLAAHFLTDRKGARTLPLPDKGESFSFVVLADATDAGPNNVDVLRMAVGEVNLLGPDLVLNVGDIIQGYCDRDRWLVQMKEIRQVMDGLAMPWFPVPGNHDIYWSSKLAKPPGEHESDYEEHFGPLWYAVQHKGCWFIVLYSDEGDPNIGKKSFSDPNAQVMSPRQTRWLESTLKKTKGARHIFVFLHQPRWTGGDYGQDWQRIHPMLSKAGVSAVFGGHHHLLQFDGNRDGVRYYRLGTTGGSIEDEVEPDAFHHYFLVTVHPKAFSVTAIRVGSVYDPQDKQFQRWILLPHQDWQIGLDRKVDLAVEIPDLGGLEGILQIGVVHSIDESGDKGLEVQVLDQDQKDIYRQFISDKGTVWIQCPVKEKTRYLVRLYDRDTPIGGQTPANSGAIVIRLRTRKEIK